MILFHRYNSRLPYCYPEKERVKRDVRKRFGSQGRGSTQSSMKLMTYSNGLELTLVSSSFAIVWRSSYATVRLQFGSSLYIGFPEALF